MLYITIILVLVYGVAIALLFMKVDPKSLAITPFITFPPLSATMVTLLGISHAGYLTYKAVPRPVDGTIDPTAGGKATDPTAGGKATE